MLQNGGWALTSHGFGRVKQPTAKHTAASDHSEIGKAHKESQKTRLNNIKDKKKAVCSIFAIGIYASCVTMWTFWMNKAW
jgi:hypothetical protein